MKVESKKLTKERRLKNKERALEKSRHVKSNIKNLVRKTESTLDEGRTHKIEGNNVYNNLPDEDEDSEIEDLGKNEYTPAKEEMQHLYNEESDNSNDNSESDRSAHVENGTLSKKAFGSSLDNELKGEVSKTTFEKPKTFKDLNVSPFLTQVLKAMSINMPTPIQQLCIPDILKGRDGIGSAETGLGKTLAFAIPIIQKLANDPQAFYALILTPTRELVYQMYEQFEVLKSSINLSVAVVVGGQDMQAQALALRSRPNIVMATPGRLRDLLESNPGEFDMSRLKVLVLDEADQLLTPTFGSDLKYIFDYLPINRQTLLFTATVTDPVMALKNKEPAPGRAAPFVHLANAVSQTSDKNNLPVKIPDTLGQKYIFVPSQVRKLYLVYVLSHICSLAGISPNKSSRVSVAKPASLKKLDSKREKDEALRQTPDANGDKLTFQQRQDLDWYNRIRHLPQMIVFVDRKQTASHLALLLANIKPIEIPCVTLHSQMSQKGRFEALERFRAGTVPILIATDVASRGLDLPQVRVVINYNVPRSSNDYVHRIGRTARAGRTGLALTFVTESDVDLVLSLEKAIGQKLENLPVDEDSVLELYPSVSTADRLAVMEMSQMQQRK